MKTYPLITILLLLVVNTYAQTTVQGTVVDKDTGQPISDVIVQYGSTSRDYIYTDKSGRFTLPESSQDVIYFQSIGYKTRSVIKTDIIANPVVTMELTPVALNPVVISPDDADKILDEVMLNTKKNLLTDTQLAYLLHFLQTKKTDTLQNEIYMKYGANLKAKDLKKNLKKERLPYIFKIADIKRAQKAVTPTSEIYGAEYHASHLFTFGKSKNNTTTKSFTSDSSMIILNITPLPGKEGWANGEIYIRKKDMTIFSMEIESVDSMLLKQPYRKYLGRNVKILRKFGRFEFGEMNNKYYMKDGFTYYRFQAINEYGIEEEITYYCDVNSLGEIDENKLKNRRLSGYCQELFYFPDSTPEDFWLMGEDYIPKAVDYVAPLDITKLTTMDAIEAKEKYKEPSKTERFLNAMLKVAPFAALLGVLAII